MYNIYFYKMIIFFFFKLFLLWKTDDPLVKYSYGKASVEKLQSLGLKIDVINFK